MSEKNFFNSYKGNKNLVNFSKVLQEYEYFVKNICGDNSKIIAYLLLFTFSNSKRLRNFLEFLLKQDEDDNFSTEIENFLKFIAKILGLKYLKQLLKKLKLKKFRDRQLSTRIDLILSKLSTTIIDKNYHSNSTPIHNKTKSFFLKNKIEELKKIINGIINSLSTVIEMLINLPHKISHTLFNLINEDYIKNNYRIDNIMNREMNSENTNTSKILNTKFTPIKTSTIGFNNIGLNTIQSYCKNNKNFSNNVINFPRVFSTITNDYTNSYNKNNRDNNSNNNNKKTKVNKIKDPYNIETTDAKQKILKNPNQELNPERSKELKQEMNQEKNQKKLQKHEQNNKNINKTCIVEKRPKKSKHVNNNFNTDDFADMFKDEKNERKSKINNICKETGNDIKLPSFTGRLEQERKNKNKGIDLFPNE